MKRLLHLKATWMTSVLMAALVLAGCGGSNTSTNKQIRLSKDYVCSRVDKTDVETMMQTGYVYERDGNISFPDTSYCEYGDGPVAKVQIYYFSKQSSYDSAPVYHQTQPIIGLGFEAQKVYVPSNGDIVQILGKSRSGALSMVFTYGIADQGSIYQNALLLLKKLVHVFP